MKIRRLLINAGCVLFLLTAGVLAQRNNNLTDEVQSARDLLLSRSASEQDVHRSIVNLVETLSRIAQESFSLSADSKEKIASAAIIVRKNPLDDQVRLALSDAYMSIHREGFTFPAGIDSIESATALARARVDNGLKAIQQERLDQAAKDILDFVLIVITPMERVHDVLDSVSIVMTPMERAH